jgi:hypothetical protein
MHPPPAPRTTTACKGIDEERKRVTEMETTNVNLRDVQQLHNGINLAMDALRRITTMAEVASVQAFGTPMAFDPFGVTRASLEHAAYNSRLGWGANPFLNQLQLGYGITPSYGINPSYVSPLAFDAWTRGLSHSAFGNVVTNPMAAAAVQAINSFGAIPTAVPAISPLGTVTNFGQTVTPFGAIPYVPFRTW